MEKLGTNYGGWYVPLNMNLNENSIIYSGGVGEDMSFDLLMQQKYKSTIYLIDPTKKAIKHFEEIKKFYINKEKITGGIQKDYYSCIQTLKPNLDKFQYINIGLWNCKDTLKFYKQENPDYVSQSLIQNMFSNEFDEIEVDSIKNIMEKYNHTTIDLLKLDIEGAEIKTLNQMLDDKIYPKYILVEFDLHLKNKDTNKETKQLINRLILKNDYKILKNDNYNITFFKN